MNGRFLIVNWPNRETLLLALIAERIMQAGLKAHPKYPALMAGLRQLPTHRPIHSVWMVRNPVYAPFANYTHCHQSA